VLATEISKSSVQAAQHNLAANDCGNVTLVRMSSDEISTALNGGRDFFRLRDIDLGGYAFGTLLVDPPRAGLDATTLQLASRFDRVLYISCNPDTLRDNLRALAASHRIAAFALFDQFPYTHHMECGVLLQRR
jgi:tRNA (uracil-5-)-methyltransferase